MKYSGIPSLYIGQKHYGYTDNIIIKEVIFVENFHVSQNCKKLAQQSLPVYGILVISFIWN